MAVRGVTFSKQTVSSNDDAHIYEILLNGRTGKTKGCKMTFDVDNIYISNGYFFAENRLIEISSTETVTTPIVTAGTLYCRLVFELDFSKLNSNSEFNQGSFKVLTNSSSYPAVIQQDIENGGNIYQLPFAKFTKSISGISTFVSELEAVGYVKEPTIYVATSGNDASGDGSATYPFRTIQHAVDCASKDLAGKEITINVSSGTYSEDVEVSGFSGGSLRFDFAGSVTIASFSALESSVILSGTALNISASGKTYGLHCHRGSNIICQLPVTITGSTNGLFVGYGSRFAGRSKITINSCTYAVTSTYAAMVYLIEIDGSKNNNGVQAAAGIAMIGTISTTMASTLYITVSGGRIYTGAQSNVSLY